MSKYSQQQFMHINKQSGKIFYTNEPPEVKAWIELRLQQNKTKY